MMNISLYQFYTDKVAALTAEIVELKCHNTTFVLAELAAFVAMLASLVAYTLTSIGVLFIILAVISFAVYYFIRQVDAGKNYKADECERLLKVYENERSYLNASPASMQERSISTRDTRLRSTWIYSVLNLSLTA